MSTVTTSSNNTALVTVGGVSTSSVTADGQPAPHAPWLSFHLPEGFIDEYREREVPWGFPMGGGNTLGELTFVTKYSRLKDDGSKERWYEVCRRCIEGQYSILKDWCVQNRTPWNEAKALASAKDGFDRMFNFKWLPPGRGLWMMGTEFVHANNNSAGLQNCSFLSFEKLSSHSVKEATLPFMRLMEMSMLGVGVGFDTKGAGSLDIHEPTAEVEIYVIPDTREGWCDSVGKLLESYFFKNRKTVEFDYSLIRKAGERIRGFGGTAAGPGPLKQLHESLRNQFAGRSGDSITSEDIVDICNKIGKCVVAGNVRRSAMLALGEGDDKDFLNLKDWNINPERMGPDGWGNLSNNSIVGTVGGDYGGIAERIANNGEPGIVWLDLCRQYGRLADSPNNKDYKVQGTNPCSEQSLESYEVCTLVENFPFRHDSFEDFTRTLKHSYLYGKAVTLMPTHWEETNEIIRRNHRIGCSVSGVVQFAEMYGWSELRRWLDDGYAVIDARDKQYSEWLGVRESIKMTSVKPSGSVSLLSGATPGVHWPVADRYIRRMRLATNDPILDALSAAGYHVEPDVMDPTHTMVVELPVVGADVRTERDVSMWEKTAMAVLLQRYWADNQVSVTVTFQPHEADQIDALIRSYDGQLKSLSMLPLMDEGGAYAQMPFERRPAEEITLAQDKIQSIDWAYFYDGGSLGDAEGERFCANDQCIIE